MEKISKGQAWQALTWLVCAWLVRVRLDDVGPSEFGGGPLTGKLFSMAELGAVLFVVAILAMALYPRIGAAVALAATLLCLPFYLYAVMPGTFQRIFGGEYSVPAQKAFTWSGSGMAGILSLLFAAALSFRGFFRGRADAPQERPAT